MAFAIYFHIKFQARPQEPDIQIVAPSLVLLLNRQPGISQGVSKPRLPDRPDEVGPDLARLCSSIREVASLKQIRNIGDFTSFGPILVTKDMKDEPRPADRHIKTVRVGLKEPQRALRHARATYQGEEDEIPFITLKAISGVDQETPLIKSLLVEL